MLRFLALLFLPCFLWGQQLTIEDIEAMHNMEISKNEILKSAQKDGLGKSAENYRRLRKLGYSPKFISQLFIRKDVLPKLPQRILDHYNSKAKDPGISILAIGIGDYNDSRRLVPLKNAREDAENFVKHMLSIGVKPAKVALLIEEQGTYQNFAKMVKQMAKSSGLLCIFYSGHGVFLEKSGFYFTCRDTNLDKLVTSAYSLQELLKQLGSMQAQKALLFLDACHSGADKAPKFDMSMDDSEVVQNPKPKEQASMAMDDYSQKKMQRDLKQMEKPIYLLASSQANQTSKDGLFTKWLIKGLKGAADEDKDKHVSIWELSTYVQYRVNQKTKGQQLPYNNNSRAWMPAFSDRIKMPVVATIVKVVERIEISPDKITCKPNERISFSATGFTKNNERIAAKFVWRAKYGKISDTGYYTAPKGKPKDAILALLPDNKKVKKLAIITIKSPEDSFEENDTFANAISILEGRYRSLKITPKDKDWYKIYLKRGYGLEVSIAFSHKECDLDLFIYKSSGKRIAKSTSSNDNEQIKLKKLASGYYYLKVKGYKSASGGYDLVAKIIKSSEAVIAGFTYLRKKTYSTNGQTNTVKEYRHNKTGMEFVLVPGDIFSMGSTDGDSDEKPVHRVKLDSFLISKTEVTQQVYERIMGNNPSYFKSAKRPVEKVSWNDAKVFCDKVGLYLPTEAQWEYACRAGTTGKYYWGNGDMGDYCWHDRNSGSKTHEVGLKGYNAFGLYDMSGNVWEWCSDWYGNYSSRYQANPTGMLSGSERVHRGGSWDYNLASSYRSAFRDYSSPGERSNSLGFRLSGRVPIRKSKRQTKK